MDHGTNITCQHRDANGNHYPGCPLPECIDGALACQCCLLSDRSPSVTYDAAFGGRLCRKCADEAVAAARCTVCPGTEGTEEVTLKNKSTMRLCKRCARLHGELLVSVDEVEAARGAA